MDTVTVSFTYHPDEPDPDNSTGLSLDEHERLVDGLMQLGAEDVSITKDGD
jgi:hypothetical protein